MSCRNCVQCRSNVFGRAVGGGRRGNARLVKVSLQSPDQSPHEVPTFGGKIIAGGGRSSSWTLNGWLRRSEG